MACGAPREATAHGTTGGRAASYFASLLDAAARARLAAGEERRTFRIAGRTVQLLFAGRALADALTPALSHLAAPPAAPDLTVHLWDRASTGVPAPSPPWRPEDHLARGVIRGFDGPEFRTANLPVMDGFSMLDVEHATAVHWDADAARITLHERSFPLRVVLSWWATLRGLQFAHAGAVGRADGGVLIAGASGSGKSTAALACVGSHLAVASDDHVLLGDGTTPVVHGLYRSAKLHWEQLERLPGLDPFLVNRGRPQDDKALLLLDGADACRLSAGFPVKAIVVPRVTGERATRIVPAPRAAALAALAPSSMFLIPGDDAPAFRFLAGLVRRVPAYELRAGTDLAQIPHAIGRLLEGL
jgi:hypothetical protein